jgi:hypothetical protein
VRNLKKLFSVLVLGFLFAICSCQPMVFTSSDSPDRKFRCEVYHGSPSFLWGRNHRYYFRLKKPRGAELLRGNDFQYDSEKELRVEDIRFDWSADSLKVTINTSPAPVVAVTALNDNEQVWTKK